ncbi:MULTISPECIES: helix-turn-helix domain-containing protein [Hyphomonas]|nr:MULTISPECIES: helix-turn-helix transcriptional regulator [Hyphomonas]|tara:strand:+ start:7054 stop:7497 length:444 start_codon:yes stop_codon:yes gene_type:complete
MGKKTKPDRTRTAARTPRRGPDDAHNPRAATPVDKIVGMNIRRLRLDRKLSLQELAERLGISHQQLQKYETSMNRVSAGMLHAIAETLRVPVIALFEGALNGTDGKGRRPSAVDKLRSECACLVDRIDCARTMQQAASVLKALAQTP